MYEDFIYLFFSRLQEWEEKFL